MILQDTIVKNSELVDMYKVLLQQESSNHTTFIQVLLGFTALLLVATWWWNKAGAKNYIDKKVAEILEVQLKEMKSKMDMVIEEKIQVEIKKYERKIIVLEADSYRTFATNSILNKSFWQAAQHSCMAISHYQDLEEQELVTNLSDNLCDYLATEECKTQYRNDNYELKNKMLEGCMAAITRLPDYLINKKRKGIELLEKLKEMD